MQVRPSWMERSMFGRFLLPLLLIVVVGSSSFFPDTIFADEPPIKFDVPALVSVGEVDIANFSSSHGSGRHPAANEKIIRVVIPVSSEVRNSDRGNVEEFRFDVFWNRNAYPIVDYGPQTQTVSDIEGLISVENISERNRGLGFDLETGYQDLALGKARAELSKNSSAKTKYTEVPQHDVLTASGTVRRGTGAFFRFHPSKRETLEGGRDLVVDYRVPLSWRGGVLKVECRAQGQRKVIGTWRETFKEASSFVVPIYLDGDDQAQQAALSFARTELKLRANWGQHVQREQRNQSSSLLGIFSASSSAANLPKQWMHYLIQSGNDVYLTRYRSQLPESLAMAAEDFVSARQGLLKLSR